MITSPEKLEQHAPAGPNPALVFEMANAFQKSACLKAAVELDLFTVIAKGAKTIPEIAKATSASERGIKALCDYMVVQELLNKENRQYVLTPTAQVFLNRQSPAYMGSITTFLNGPTLMKRFENLTETVRRGVPPEDMTKPDNEVWVDFAKGMAPFAGMMAEQMSNHLNAREGKTWKELDIAAGHGIYGITLARQNPKAKIAALDWKAVLEVAKENAAKAGITERYETIEGDAFTTPFGNDYDVVLLTNFLHHFSPDQNVELLKKIKASLKPGGKVATIEFVPNEDRVTPPMAAMFSIIMLAGTAKGDAYTFSELLDMFARAGFQNVEKIDLLPTPQTLVLANA